MMSKILPAKKIRPFPGTCVACGEEDVFPLETDYVANVKHDDVMIEVCVENFPIATCRKCGDQTFSIGDDERITAALRRQVGLLMPDEIAQARSQLQISQQALADQIGVSQEMIAKWENGVSIQSRAMDNLLRLFFQSADARRLLSTRFEKEAMGGSAKSVPAIA